MSKTHDRARSKRAGTVKRRALSIVVGIGVGFAVLGLAAIAVNLIFFSRVVDVAVWDTDVTVSGGLFALSPSEISQLSFFLAIPGGLFLLALCFIMTGRVLRGSIGTRIAPHGGTVVAVNTYLSPRAQLVWVAVATAFWFVLVIVPVLSALGGGWPVTVRDLPQTYVWLNLGMYGALASAIAGVLVVSHLKKQRYLTMVAAEDPRLRQPPHGGWRWATFRWRFDLWLGGLGGALAGASWLSLPFGDVLFLVLPLVGGLCLAALGVWMARQYWRAGLPLGMGESFA